MNKKFYKSVVVIEVLSEDEPIEFETLDELGYLITEGPCSGIVLKLGPLELSSKEVVKELVSQGSDPEFFGLDAEGQQV